MKIAGLSIEGPLLRASIVNKRLKAFTLLKSLEIGLPEGEEERVSFLRETLLGWKQDFGIKGVVISLDFKYFTYDYVDLPVTSETEIAQALSFEMGRYLPLPAEEYVYDFHTVTTGEAGSRNLVMAVRKNRLEWTAKCLEGTGLKLLGVRCSGIEVLNEFIASETQKDAVFLSPGSSTGNHFYYMVGLKDYEPLEIKLVHADNDPAPEVEEFSQTYSRGIYTAGLKDPQRFGNLDIRELSYSVATLTALSALTKRAVSLDFTPAELRTRKADYYAYAIGFLAVLSVVLFFSTSLLAYYKDYAALRKVQARVAEIRSTSRDLVETRKKLEDINRKTQVLFEFKRKRNRQIEILRQLSIILPRDAWLTGFNSGEKGTVEIEGYAKRSAEIIEPLENSPLFKNVAFSSPVTVRGGKERFSIKMELEQ